MGSPPWGAWGRRLIDGRERIGRWLAVAALACASFWLGTRFPSGLPFGDGPAVRLTDWQPTPLAAAPAAARRSGDTTQRVPSTDGTRININTATPADLHLVLRMRRSTAERIVAYRRRHGPFSSLDDLRAVPLSASTVRRIAPFVVFR